MKPKNKKKDKISREEALKKLGFAAFTASTMFALLNNPAEAQSARRTSEPPGPNDPDDDDEEWD